MLADFFTRVISSEMEHFTARKSRQNNKLGPNFDSNKIEQGLGFCNTPHAIHNLGNN